MADTKKYVQTNTFYLAGSGAIIGATSIALTSFTDIYGNVLTMTDFGDTGYITLEPDTTNEESATFTGITPNANGTYTLTGVKTTLAKDPYTQSSGLVRQHSGGTKVVVTDNVAFWATFANKNNDETVTGIYTFATGATPLITDQASTDTMAANKLYVDRNIRVQSVADAATITPSATNDACVDITAIAQAFTLANPNGTPRNFQRMIIRILDNGTGRAITFGNQYRAMGNALPTTTIASKYMILGIMWNSTDSKWDLVSLINQA